MVSARPAWYSLLMHTNKQVSSFTGEKPNQRLGVTERIMHRMMIVLGPTQTLPLLGASEVTDESCVEIGDPSSRMAERVLSEVAPEVEVDPLKIVGRIV